MQRDYYRCTYVKPNVTSNVQQISSTNCQFLTCCLQRKMEVLPLLLTLSFSTVVISSNNSIPVHFWLFTINNLEEYEDMVFVGSSVTLSPDTLYDVTKPTKLVVHGWGGETHIDEIFALAYAEAGLDYNIIGVDWRNMEGPAQE